MAELEKPVRHTEDGNCHSLIMDSLRVLIERDGSAWFAQGLDLDYGAGGDSLDEVKRHFEEGLTATLCAHINAYGNLANLLAPAPQDVWKRYFEVKPQYLLSMCVLVAKDDPIGDWPFREIAYLEPRQAA